MPSRKKAASARSRPPLREGTKVEVRSRFDGSWSRGFTVERHEDGGYILLRESDGEPLPVPIPAADVRRERRRDTWWLSG